jgi:hypothetical protein
VNSPDKTLSKKTSHKNILEMTQMSQMTTQHNPQLRTTSNYINKSASRVSSNTTNTK